MSLFPGEMTRQIFVAPPRTIRSARYSLTARGRSISPSRRTPTGSSSFENASGWIRLPVPAAGMIPHTPSPSNLREQLVGALLGGVFLEHALPRGLADAGQLFRRARDRRDGLGGVAGDEDLLAGAEEGLDPGPVVAEHGNAARRRLEQAARGAVAHRHHRGPRHVHRQR